jgi:hypothetical protein
MERKLILYLLSLYTTGTSTGYTPMKIRTRFRLVPLLALVLAAGCEDLGLNSGADQVDGLTIQDAGGNTLVTVGASGSVSGTLTVPRNGTRALRISLTGPAGVVTPGIGESVRVTLTNSALVQWQESGTGAGTLVGRNAGGGNTSMRVDLISAGTTEYTSPAIPVQVT